jgi:hypothetical protein
MKRTSSAFVTVAIAAAFLVLGCKNTTLQESPRSSVTVNVPASNKAKTLVPGFSNIAQYGWSASGPGGATQTKPAAASGSVTFSDLLPGTWTFVATAYNVSGQALGSGNATATIAAGANTNIAILINISGADSGTGDLAITVIWPNDIDAVTGSISGGTLNYISIGTYDSFNSKALISNVASLSAGPHTLTLTFSRGGFAAGTFVEAVNIFNGLTTDHWIDSAGVSQSAWTLTSTDFLDASCSLASLQISGASGFSFDPSNTSYTLLFPQPDSFVVTPKGSLAGQRIQSVWYPASASASYSDIMSGASQSITFGSGNSTLALFIWAPDRSSSKTYNFHVHGYTLSYLPNGAAGSPAALTSVYTEGSVVLGSNSGNWADAGYAFSGWNTQANGSGSHYAAGGNFTMPAADISLFAEWISSSLAAILSNIHNGGTITLPSMTLTASELQMLKDALLGASAPVTLDLSNLANTSLPAGAFSGCTMLASLRISNAVAAIGDGFVSGCTSLSSLALGAGLPAAGPPTWGITTETFAGPLPALSTITVDASSPNYIVSNGVLYDIGMTQVFKYPSALGDSSYTIPVGVMTIRNHAFEDCPATLLEVSIPATVNNILNDSFNGFGNTVAFASSSASGIQIYGGAFGSSIAPSLQIKVPPGSLGSYTGSTYFSPFTTHISEY